MSANDSHEDRSSRNSSSVHGRDNSVDGRGRKIGRVRGKHNSREDRGRNPSSVHETTQVEHRIGQDERLLPGIPDEITLDFIAPKLPWRALYVLAAVSCGWKRAIRSRQVYDARVRSKSTHTLVPLHSDHTFTIVLYSVEDGSCCHLPGIPNVRKGIPVACEWIPLDGKLYVLGGWKDTRLSSDVYVFDLAGQRQWKKCASMANVRERFGCGVKDGKIYVFGGVPRSKFRGASEVYDPDRDAWSPVTPIPSLVLNKKVKAVKVIPVGDELFLHSGEFDGFGDAMVYHPQTDKWRRAPNFTEDDNDKLFTVGGKLHRLNQNSFEKVYVIYDSSSSIDVYDINDNSWKCRQVGRRGAMDDAVAVNGEGLAAVVIWKNMALVNWRTIGEHDSSTYDFWGTCLVKIQGVGGENTKIIWHRLQCSLDLDEYSPGLCHAFQL